MPKPVSDWIGDVAVAALSAPDPLIRRCIVTAARAYCDATRVWQEWLDPVLTDGKPGKLVSFDLPPMAEVVRLERASLQGQPFGVLLTREMQADPANHPAQDHGLVWFGKEDFAIWTTQENQQVQVLVSLRPTLMATSLPDALEDDHEAIVMGAKARLLMIPATDFYAPDLAAAQGILFQQWIERRSVSAWRSNTAHQPRRAVSWF